MGQILGLKIDTEILLHSKTFSKLNNFQNRPRASRSAQIHIKKKHTIEGLYVYI